MGVDAIQAELVTGNKNEVPVNPEYEGGDDTLKEDGLQLKKRPGRVNFRYGPIKSGK